MLRILSLAFFLICLHQAVSSGILGKDVYREILEKTYTSRHRNLGRADEDDDVGSPLLLTPYIENNQLQEAREAAYVNPDHLVPGIDSYAGYLTVNKEYNSNLWFWYFPVNDQPVADTPWLIWLQGGPGSSSLFGLFKEIGPFVVTENKTLDVIKYSWGRNHSLLFIDQPVGTGFSFTDDDRGYARSHTAVGEDLYAALQQFLTLFPELREAPLTISGESYAGKYIPAIGIQILRNKNDEQPINLHGLAIGNGLSDPITQMRPSAVAREVGVLDDRMADVMQAIEEVMTSLIDDGDLDRAFNYFSEYLDVLQTRANLSNVYNYLTEEDDLDGPHVDFVRTPEVRRELHVGSTNYTTINYDHVYNNLKPVFLQSVKPWIEELLGHYRVLIYSGHLDLMVAYKPTADMCTSLSFSGSSEFRSKKRVPWYHDGIIAGYVRQGGNLLEVMVRGAGHMVPSDKPAPALALISAFARGIPLSVDTAWLVPPEDDAQRSHRLVFDEPWL